MKIALLGYGKMGKTIEKIAFNRKHDIVLRQNTTTLEEADLANADVAIDFSVPNAAFQNISTCLALSIPVISGTTGWLHQYEEACNLVKKHQGKFIYASNFSIGVNLFFQLNTYLAKMMNNFADYQVHLEEIHHTEKLDAPSGTAITLAQDIVQQHQAFSNWAYPSSNASKGDLPIDAQRIEDVKGTHVVTYENEIDQIQIKHTAHTRDGFALGAVLAAEWLVQQPKSGTYHMKDVLNNQIKI